MNPRDSMGGTHEGFLRETGNSDNPGHELEVSGVRKVSIYYNMGDVLVSR